jgi:hypothetical protein
MRAIASPFVPTYRGAHLRSAVQSVWDKFGFVAPRRSSVALSKGAGAFSFTRATTATVEDWEGAIKVCKSGEVRFPGARRVENLIATTSEDFSNAAWGVSAGGTGSVPIKTPNYTGVAAPDGTFTACRLQAALNGGTTNTDQSVMTNVGVGVSGPRQLPSAWLRTTDGSTQQVLIRGNGTISSVSVTGEWKRFASLLSNASSSIQIGTRGGAIGTPCTDSVDVLIWHPQVEEVPATSPNPGVPAEYVPVGAAKLNELTFTNEFDNAAWTKVRASITPNAVDGPLGGFGCKLVEDGTAADVHLLNRVAGSTGVAATFSVYAKAAERSQIALQVGSSTSFFDLSAGTVLSGAGTIELVGDGWYRCSHYDANPANANTQIFIVVAGAATYNGDGTSGVYLYGAQLLRASTPGDYFPVGNVYPFHGACVDGVQYLEHQNGNTVASNVVTEAAGATLTTCKGQLDETSSANLVLQASNFGTTWAAVGTPTRTAAAKYCGSIALDLIGDDDGAALEGYTQTVTFTGNADKSVSFLVAPDTSTSTAVRLRDTTAGADRLLGVVTWSSGTPTFTPTTGTQERAPKQLANGCWRIFCKAAGVVAANTNSLQFYPATDAALAVGATGRVYIGGVQAENATTASSHIPTTTATVTRNADAGSYPAAGNVSASGGTLFVEYEIERESSGDHYLAEIGDGTLNERLALFVNATDKKLIAYVVDGGGQQCRLELGVVAIGDRGKVAFRWAENDFAAVMTGGTVKTDASGTVPTMTTIYPGRASSGGFANGPTKNLRISQQLLSNAELLALVA